MYKPVFVVLEREPYKHNVKYRDKSEARAYERTMALCDLHSCDYDRHGECIVIHASEAYKPRSK
jgi:hypothetical protein